MEGYKVQKSFLEESKKNRKPLKRASEEGGI